MSKKFMREHDFDDDEFDYISEKINNKNKSKERRMQRALRTKDVQLLAAFEEEDE
jgi:hypothetical protein